MEIVPFLIPLFALSIPIVAIIANAMTKKYKAPPEAHQEFRDHVKKLENKVAELEETVTNMSSEINRLETDQQFLSRLLEDKSGDAPQNS